MLFPVSFHIYSLPHVGKEVKIIWNGEAHTRIWATQQQQQQKTVGYETYTSREEEEKKRLQEIYGFG